MVSFWIRTFVRYVEESVVETRMPDLTVMYLSASR